MFLSFIVQTVCATCHNVGVIRLVKTFKAFTKMSHIFLSRDGLATWPVFISASAPVATGINYSWRD